MDIVWIMIICAAIFAIFFSTGKSVPSSTRTTGIYYPRRNVENDEDEDDEDEDDEDDEDDEFDEDYEDEYDEFGFEIEKDDYDDDY